MRGAAQAESSARIVSQGARDQSATGRLALEINSRGIVISSGIKDVYS